MSFLHCHAMGERMQQNVEFLLVFVLAVALITFIHRIDLQCINESIDGEKNA